MTELDPFSYLETYRVLVCLQCRYGCVSDEVPTHLRCRHKDIATDARRQIAGAASGIPGIIKNQAQLAAEFRFPPPTIHRILELEPPRPVGRACRRCGLIFKHDQQIQQHCETCQNWSNPQGRGRPRLNHAQAHAQKPWREGVWCQRFFRSRAASGWFEVGRKSAGRGTAFKADGSITDRQSLLCVKLSPETRLHIDHVLRRETKYRDAELQPRFYSKALGDDSFAGTSLWLGRTQWPITYENVRRDILQAMSRLPGHIGVRSPMTDYVLGQGPSEGDPHITISREDEEMIACILSAVDAMLDRCELTARNTSRMVLCWLASCRLDVYQPKPFALRVEEVTRKRYRLLWKRFIAFTLRLYRLPNAIRERELKIRLDPQTWMQLEHLWKHRAWQSLDTRDPRWPKACQPEHDLDHFPRSNDMEINIPSRLESRPNDDTSSLSGDESNIESESDEESEREDSVSDWTSETESHWASDVQPSRQDSCPVISDSTEETSRREFLELIFELSRSLSTQGFEDGRPGSALLVYFSGVLGFSADCRRFQLAREYCPALSGLIWIQRLIFLEYALPLQPYPTLGLQQRPRFPMQRLNEVRQKYMVQGSPSPLAELHSLRNFGQKVAKTEPPPFLLRWSDDGDIVSYGSDFSLSMDKFRELADHFITRAEEQCDEFMFGLDPRLDIKMIKDDFTNAQPGFSFVSHPENNFDSMYQDLLVQACTSRGERLVRNGRWSFRAMASYLQKVADMEENISGGLLTACGQPVRIRDLLTLAVDNSPHCTKGATY